MRRQEAENIADVWMAACAIVWLIGACLWAVMPF